MKEKTIYDAIDIANVNKNATTDVRVRLYEFNGMHFLDVRLFAVRRGGEVLPTRKGISLTVERIGELVAALQQAQKEARCLGWLDTREAPQYASRRSPAAAKTHGKVAAMANCGYTQAQIATHFGLDKSTISRAMRKAKEAGLLARPNCMDVASDVASAMPSATEPGGCATAASQPTKPVDPEGIADALWQQEQHERYELRKQYRQLRREDDDDLPF